MLYHYESKKYSQSLFICNHFLLKSILTLIKMNDNEYAVPALRKYIEDNHGPINPFENKTVIQNAHKNIPQRIILSLNEMRVKNKELCKKVIEDPINLIPYVENELNCLLSFVGSFGEYQLTPSSISSDFLGKMVKIEGIITSLSNIKPKLLRSIHEQKNVFFTKDYRDATTLTPFTLTSDVIPFTMQNQILNFEYGLSTYIDTQSATIQEMPENTKPGAIPRSINVIFYNDLTDSVKPGDRVVLTGIYKAFCHNNNTYPNFLPTALIANHVENKNIKKILESKLNIDKSENQDYQPSILTSENVLDHVAPFIYIPRMIKKAVLLQMIGSENQHCRKSINIMLLGDPSTAKSQILRFVINTINAISTSGKGSTGVGLTASIVCEKNERRLEAGAMVLADNSIICIDEFDKINYVDSVVLHEVMEQQSISINKAGIHVTLNARTAVLAAANPIYGNFTDDSLEKQIKIPDSLLSRFDLIFLVFDDGVFDSEIADQVLNNHMDVVNAGENNILELQKYIFECKKIKPKLLRESAQLIADLYVELRESKTRFPITPRLLDSLIRLSNANARFRKSEIIDEQDVTEAIQMVEHCYKVTDQSQFKRIKVKEFSETVPAGQILHVPSEHSEIIKDLMIAYRDQNPTISFMTLTDITSKCELTVEEITNVLTELDAQDIIMFRGETIIFLN